MAYSADIANLLTDQLTKLTTLNRHQLAGQVANLDFWLNEVGHALAVIDGYPARFTRMKRAQTGHVGEFTTREFELNDPDAYLYEAHASAPKPPKPVPDTELREGRRALCQATARFLSRCAKEGLVDESTVQRESERLRIGADSTCLS